MKILYLSLACIGAYLIGSLPFSVWIGKKAKGVDLRKHHVRNPGGLNAVMTFGPLLGGTILFLDFFKGTFTILLLDQLFSLEYFKAIDGTNIWYTLAVFLGPLMCILGHNYSVWLKFDGGQGLGVYMGTVLYLNPLVFLFHNIFIISIMMTKKVNVRLGTFIAIILEAVIILLIPIFPPWTNIHLNAFTWTASYIHLKATIIIAIMASALIIRLIQSIAKKSKSAAWRVGEKGEQQFN